VPGAGGQEADDTARPSPAGARESTHTAEAGGRRSPGRKKPARQAAPAAGATAAPVALATHLVDAGRAAIGLSALAMFVAGFAVGHWFRMRKEVNGAVRTMHDPLVALGIGVTAALITAGLVWLALRMRRRAVAVAVVVVGGAAAAVASAVLWIAGMTALRTPFTFARALETTQGTLKSAAWVLPPGLFWGVGSATVVLVVAEARKKQARDALDQALWSGGLWLTAVGEGCALVLGEGTLPIGVTATGMILGLLLVGSVIKRRPLKDPPEGFLPRRQLIQKTMAALLAVQAWVGVIWLYWKR
jgi:hypothetical protein